MIGKKGTLKKKLLMRGKRRKRRLNRGRALPVNRREQEGTETKKSRIETNRKLTGRKRVKPFRERRRGNRIRPVRKIRGINRKKMRIITKLKIKIGREACRERT